jgi:hypothetical protein
MAASRLYAILKLSTLIHIVAGLPAFLLFINYLDTEKTKDVLVEKQCVTSLFLDD